MLADRMRISSCGNKVIKWVAVGSFGIGISSDGIKWNVVDGFSYVKSVIFANGRWIVVGNNGLMAMSDDGSLWEIISEGWGTTTLYSIAYSKLLNLYVLVGRGIIYTSSDLITWTKETLPTDFTTSTVINTVGVRDIDVYPYTAFVIGSSSGLLAYSTSGKTWYKASSGITLSINKMIFHPVPVGNMLAVCNRNTFIRSNASKLTSWIKSSIGMGGSTYDAYDVVYSGDKNTTVIVGQNSDAARGIVYNNEGGIIFSPSNHPYEGNYIYSVAYGDNIFIAGTVDGDILLSQDGIDWSIIQSVLPSKISSIAYGGE